MTPMTTKLMTVYGSPDTDNPRDFLATYDELIAQYPADVQAEAVKRVLASHRFKSWPTIAECLKACEAVTGERMPKRMQQHAPATWRQEPLSQAGRAYLTTYIANPDENPIGAALRRLALTMIERDDEGRSA